MCLANQIREQTSQFERAIFNNYVGLAEIKGARAALQKRFFTASFKARFKFTVAV